MFVIRRKRGLRKEGEIALMDNVSLIVTLTFFTEDQILARYALSPKLMERFCGLKEKFNSPISMVLRNREVIVAVNLGKNSFEPSLKSPCWKTIRFEIIFRVSKVSQIW